MRPLNFMRYFLAFLWLCASSLALAAPGDVDFITKTRIPGGDNEANVVLVQPDGKFLTAGYARYGTVQFAITRYNADGTLDTSFAFNGTMYEPLGAGDSVANGLALQSDGKIVTGGYVDFGTQRRFAIARFFANGLLDTSFGGGGAATVVGAGNAQGNALVIQPDGSILVAGSATDGSHVGFAVVRYTTGAQLDTSFGSGTGKVITPLGGADSQAYAVALQGDGRIVVAGTSGGLMAVARYNADGSLDTTFNGVGYRTIAGGFTSARAVAIQSDGKIVLGGDASGAFGFARLNADGSLDATFNGSGTRVVAFTNGANLQSLVVQGDGKIVGGGFAAGTTRNNAALVRLNANGTLDTGFGSSGTAVRAVTPAEDVLRGMALLSDGRLVLAGMTYGNPGSSRDALLAMFNSSGGLDTSFNGGNGYVTTDAGSAVSMARGVAIQSDGKIVAAGWMQYDSVTRKMAVARYNTDGSMDGGFGSNGIATGGWEAHAVALQSDGKIVAAGTVKVSGNMLVQVARFLSNGTLDSAFGSGGLASISINGVDDEANAVAIQSDGKIVVAGVSKNGAFNDSFFARLNGDGSVDASFNGSGKIAVPMSTGSDQIDAIAIQGDGKIVGTGYVELSGSQTGFASARVNADGTLDSAFGSGGVVTTAIGSFSSFAHAIAVQSDGKILAAGQVFNGSTDDFAVVRYNANGTLDTSFGSGGIARNDLGNHNRLFAMQLLGDGRIAVAGEWGGNFTAALYTASGSLDSSFGSGGAVSVQVNAESNVAYALAIQPSDGKWVLAGSGSGLMGIARLIGTTTTVTPPPPPPSSSVPTTQPVRADFNGDGKWDLVWQDGNNAISVWLMNGMSASASAQVLPGAAGVLATKVGDFNGDGKTDFVRQFADGSINVYLMNGLTVASVSQISSANSLHRLINVGDFNGDGMTDLLIQDSDGGTEIWLMSGGAIAQDTVIMSGSIAAGWYVTKVADFNHDGKADLLWTNPQGGIGIWTMNGTTATDKQVVFNNGSGWVAIGVADFNADGNADILFLNTNTGGIGEWLMNGTQALAKQSVFSAATGWSITQVGDFNGDGKADLIWTYTAGDTGMWLMDGLYPTSKQAIMGGGTGWKVTQTCDANGDGMQDLQWTNTDGSAAQWLMNGMTRIDGGLILGAGSGWSLATSVGQNN